MSRVGERIKQARIENGMTPKQLSKKMGASESFINEVENGRKIVNEEIMKKFTKILGDKLNDIGMSFEEEVQVQIQVEKKIVKAPSIINEVWSDAFGLVLKNVPVYKYDLNNSLYTKQMPLISNKIEGFAQDKVLFLEIEDDDMIGFRIAKGDIAFSHITHEVFNNSICLIELDENRCLRQIKKLDNNKLLLISNKGTLKTETVNIKDIQIHLKLEWVQMKL